MTYNVSMGTLNPTIPVEKTVKVGGANVDVGRQPTTARFQG